MKISRLFALLALAGFTLGPSAFGATPAEAVAELIPKLAAPNVPDRYAAQMELQQLAANASKPGAGAAREELGKALAAKAAEAAVPQPARVWIVRQLEYMGGAEAVPALTQLLADPDAELRECARRALEKNPAPAASASLRAALQKGGDAAWKGGLIAALGQRQDAAAVALIAPQLGDAQTGVHAALALGRIATPAAVAALWKSAGQNAAVADGLILAANQMAASGSAAPAKAIYEKLYAQPGLLLSVRAAALTGLAKVDAKAAAPLVNAALTAAEPRLQDAAILAAPLALGKNCSRTLAGLMPKLSPRAKGLVLNVLDADAEKTVLEAVNDREPSVRLAAIDALGRMGGAASVPVLLTLATTDGKPEKAAAEAALGQANGAGAAEAVAQAASAGDAKLRAAALNALVGRKQVKAMPVIFQAAADANATVSKAACSALGRLAGDADLGGIVQLALKTGSGDAAAALEAAVQRAQDKPAAAKQILAAATDEAKQVALLDALAAAGGSDALAAVVKLSASPSADTREAAIKALGNWSDFAAAKPLVALAADTNLKANLYAAALQGVVRLVKSAEGAAPADLADAAVAALSAARTEADKKLALTAFGFVPHPKAVETIKQMLGDPKFKTDAGQAGIALAETWVRTERTAGKDLAKIIKDADVSADITKRADRVLSR